MIYITGATGFIGSRVARGLLARGERIRCLVRSARRAAWLQELGAELVESDVTDRDAQLRGLQGATAAIHVAGLYDVGTVDRAALWRTNVDGSRALLAAAAETGTARVVFVSSTAAFGPVTPDRLEPRDAYAGPYPSEYHRAKAEAHRIARAAQHAGQPVVIVCPAFVYGPGDAGPAGNFVHDVVHRKLPILLRTPSWFSYVYVDDVADGIVAALDRGTAGEVYVLSGEETNVNDYGERIARLAGVKPPPLRMPAALSYLGAVVLDAFARLTRRRFMVSAESVRIGARDRWLHTHERAARELGYAPRPLAEGLPPTVAWARERTRR